MGVAMHRKVQRVGTTCAVWLAACTGPGTGGGFALDTVVGTDGYSFSGLDAAADVTMEADSALQGDGEPTLGDGAPQDDTESDVAAELDGFFDPVDASGSGADSTVTPGLAAPPWLLTLDNATRTLRKVDIVTGKSAVVCTLANKYAYPSLTFRRDNVLMASAKGAALDRIDPCTCAVTAVGVYGGGATSVNGITSDQAQGLYGISAGLQSLIAIDPKTGAAKVVGALGVKFGANGATWSDQLKALYAINGADDKLYTVNPQTGAATFQAKLSQSFTSVGVERHPGNGKIYACTDDSVLRVVDPTTGVVSTVGDMGTAGGCTNLAAPWGPVACVDAVVIP